MKTKTGMSIGLALTLMVGVFATMLALGLFTTTEVQAQPAETDMVTGVSVSHSPETRDAFATVTVEFTTSEDPDGAVDPLVGGPLAVAESIVITFDAGVALPTAPILVATGQVTVNNVATGAAFAGQVATVAVPDMDAATAGDQGIGAEVDVTVVFGLLTTPTTADAITNPAVPGVYDVGVTTTTDTVSVSSFNFLYLPSNIDNTTINHTPSGVGDPAKITVTFVPESGLQGGIDSINLQFEDDVKFPSILQASQVTISATVVADNALVQGTAAGTGSTANPAGVIIQYTGTPADEPLITLDLGDMDPAEGSAGFQGIRAGATVTVVFQQSAGITNPTEAGGWGVSVSTSHLNGSNSDTSEDFRFGRALSLSSASGTRGATVTVTGKGFKNGVTAVVWVEDEGDTSPDEKTGAETELCNALISGGDTFTCQFVVNASNFTAGVDRIINASDGRSQEADVKPVWELLGRVTAVPDSASIGETVSLEFVDFPAGAITRLQLGGVNLLYHVDDRPDGIRSFDPSTTGSVPLVIPDTAALGLQSLAAANGTSGTRRDTLTILGAQVTVTPSTVVPNQSVTITGRGFTSGGRISSGHPLSRIQIGGTPITEWNKINGGNAIEIDNSGSWVATVVLPVTVPVIDSGTYAVRIVDSAGRPGATNVTVPSRTVTFDPPESRVGSTVTVSGAGWIASNSATGSANSDVEVRYDSGGGDTSSRATPDSDGNFSATIRVPLNAAIPSTNRVTVFYTLPAGGTRSETVSHRVPGADLTISPVSGPGGTLATLTGVGFKAFTSVGLVTVDGIEVQPKPAGASAGRDGVLESITILIPALDPGTKTVKAIVGGTGVGGATVNTSFIITADDALPPPTEATTPAAAFAALIDSGSLITVFRYNEDTQAYQSYDPDPANAGFNDLDTVNSGDIFWVRLSEDQTFLGKLRRAPWAQVVLP